VITTRKRQTLKYAAIVVVLLIVQFALRSYNITVQGAFVDEGRHNERAVEVWQFTENPGQISQGKLLLYYWLGLFEGDRLTSLLVSRTAIALFSLITGAVVYRLARQFGNYQTGILALLVYCFFPLALFHERLAFADPFAGGITCLVAWRSIVFGKRPTLREGMILGLLLALATLAKLTIVLLPVLPVVATIIYYPMQTGTFRTKVLGWMRDCLPGLCAAAAVMILLWLPILIPAYLASKTDHPFILVNSNNIVTSGIGPTTSFDYLITLFTTMNDFAGALFFAGVGLAIIVLLVRGIRSQPAQLESVMFLLFWAALLISAMLGFAAGADARYMVPLAAPMVILLACGIGSLWAALRTITRWRRLVRTTLVVAIVAWLVTFAVPFSYFSLTDPTRLPLHDQSYWLYISGQATADTTTQTVIQMLNAPNFDAGAVYGDQIMCYVLYFYVQRHINCLDDGDINPQLPGVIQANAGQSIDFVVKGDETPPQAVDGTCLTRIVHLNRDTAPAIDIWQLTQNPCAVQQQTLGQ